VAALLQELGPHGWTVVLDEPRGEPCGALLEGHLQLGRGGGLGWLVVDRGALPTLPSAWTERLDLARLRGLALGLPMQVASLRIASGELSTLSAGDVVLFPGCPSPADELGGLLRVGGGGFPSTAWGLLGTKCRVRIDGPFRIGGVSMVMTEAKDRRAIAEQLELEVAVELGRVKISAAQLLELDPGDVLTLDRPLGAPLELRVADRLVARGELVEVEGETGVRLTQLYD
jgi:type III secretion system YscQ/HrcQ family protein